MDRFKRRRLFRPRKAPGCTVEKWFWERSSTSRLLRLDSSALPRKVRLFWGRWSARESWASSPRIGVRERSPTAVQSVVLP